MSTAAATTGSRSHLKKLSLCDASSDALNLSHHTCELNWHSSWTYLHIFTYSPPFFGFIGKWKRKESKEFPGRTHRAFIKASTTAALPTCAAASLPPVLGPNDPERSAGRAGPSWARRASVRGSGRSVLPPWACRAPAPRWLPAPSWLLPGALLRYGAAATLGNPTATHPQHLGRKNGAKGEGAVCFKLLSHALPRTARKSRVNRKARLRPLQRCGATSLQEASGARLGRGRRVPPALPPSLPPVSLTGASTSRPGTAAAGTAPHPAAALQAGRGEARGRGAGRRPPTHPRRDLVDGVAAGVAARLRHGVEAGQVGAALPRAQHPAAAPAAPPARHRRKRRPGTPRPARAAPGARPGEPRPAPRDARIPRSRGFPELGVRAAGMRPRCRGPDVAGTARRRRGPVPGARHGHGRGGFTLGGDWPPSPSVTQAAVASTNP